MKYQTKHARIFKRQSNLLRFAATKRRIMQAATAARCGFKTKKK